MKKINLTKEIENILYTNRLLGALVLYEKSSVIVGSIALTQENIKDIVSKIKNIVYNNYRRRKKNGGLKCKKT